MIIEALVLKALLSLKALVIIAKAWTLHAVSLGFVFLTFLLKGVFVHLLLLFAVVGWLSFSGADPSWQVWLKLLVRLLNPLSLFAFAGAFVWDLGLWLTEKGWIVSSLPLWGLTIALVSPSLVPLPFTAEVIVYLILLTLFWSLFSRDLPRLWAQWRQNHRIQAP